MNACSEKRGEEFPNDLGKDALRSDLSPRS